MAREDSFTLHRPRRNPLVLAVCACFALAIPGVAAADWIVNSCDEGSSGNLATKTGTLRFAAANAGIGDTINLSALSCPGSKISLTTGSIALAQSSITLVGPGPAALTIDATSLSPGAIGDFRVLTHGGGGKLTVTGLGLSGGHVYHSGAAEVAKGGCIYSSAAIDLDHVGVEQCSASSSSNVARGAGIYAVGSLTIKDSVVSGNHATGPVGAFGGGAFGNSALKINYSVIAGNGVTSAGDARGGGAYAADYLRAAYSSISGNVANGSGAAGGGLAGAASVSLFASTISGNSSAGKAGGLFAHRSIGYYAVTLGLANTTVSGNTASNVVGGIYTNAGNVFIEDSTIAFNSAGAGKVAGTLFAPGVASTATGYNPAMEIGSSIIAYNTYGATENDVSVAADATFVSGQYDLVRVAQSVIFGQPPSTACPLLGPLRDNGGLTLTHALQSGSPAIDAGIAIDTADSDQRGAANVNGTRDYYRQAGPLHVVDIGAYEVQDEVVFNAGFDGCQ